MGEAHPPILHLEDGRRIVFVSAPGSGGEQVRRALGQSGPLEVRSWHQIDILWGVGKKRDDKDIVVGIVRNPRQITLARIWRACKALMERDGWEMPDVFCPSSRERLSTYMWQAWETEGGTGDMKEKGMMATFDGVAFNMNYLLHWDTLERDLQVMCNELGIELTRALDLGDLSTPPFLPGLMEAFITRGLGDEEQFYAQLIAGWGATH